MEAPQVFISVTQQIQGRTVKASVNLPLDADERLIEGARHVLHRYIEREKAEWEEEAGGDLDFWTHPAICSFQDREVMVAMPMDIARSIAFPVQKEFSGYDTTGKTCGEVFDDNPSLAEWLAWKFTAYERIPAQKAAVCAMRKIVTHVAL